VELQAFQYGGVDELEEPQKLLAAVAALGLGDDRAAGQVERGEEARGAVADLGALCGFGSGIADRPGRCYGDLAW
jgi:hypothetical protein